ncbi:MAG: hypothetical protein PHO67_08975 [Candidatus Omnitrophica bacterium]|nr:hypothetical protein [Candidatus Omnitrophota bacterium]
MTIAVRIHNDGPLKIRVTNTIPNSIESGPGMGSVEVDPNTDAPITYVHSKMSIKIDEIES